MERFLIVTNDGKDVDHAVTSKVKETLEKAGKICTLCQKDAQKNIRKDTPCKDPPGHPENIPL